MKLEVDLKDAVEQNEKGKRKKKKERRILRPPNHFSVFFKL